MRIDSLIDGRRVKGSKEIDIVNPYNRQSIGRLSLLDKDLLKEAVKAGVNGKKNIKKRAAYELRDILEKVSQKIENQKNQIAETISIESGKPITLAKIEADRAVFTFKRAAEESTRIYSERIELDAESSGKGSYAIVKKVPIGLILGITPFNFPLNLVAHKVAPAIASKNGMILKPALKTPITASILADIILESGIEPSEFNMVFVDDDLATDLVKDDSIDMVSFTGSDKVGWMIKANAGKKKVVLELGGNATAIIADDADLDYAVSKVVVGGFGYSGQVCISVQHLLVQEKIFDEALALFVKKTNEMIRSSDPSKSITLNGPLVDEKSLLRIDSIVKEVIDNKKGELMIGGSYKDTVYAATILKDVKPDALIMNDELFGPVVTVNRYKDIKEAIEIVNRSRYGLQASIFTNRFDDIELAFDLIDVGGLIVNDFPTYRSDIMPYGGFKDSGIGREGIRYAIDEMSQLKSMIVRRR